MMSFSLFIQIRICRSNLLSLQAGGKEGYADPTKRSCENVYGVACKDVSATAVITANIVRCDNQSELLMF